MAKTVLLVVGFQNRIFNARSKWKTLADRLEKEGFTVHVSGYAYGEPMKKRIYQYAGVVATEIEKLNPDAIIAHSMGCLVTRFAVERLGSNHPRLKLILLEGPHQGLPNRGISFARLVAKMFETVKRLPAWDVPKWASWKDLQRGSIFLCNLNKGFEDSYISYYEIGGTFAYLFPEIFSLPKEICRSGKRIFPKVTHSGLKSKPEVVDYIVEILKVP